jgi:hypothetical protein
MRKRKRRARRRKGSLWRELEAKSLMSIDDGVVG